MIYNKTTLTAMWRAGVISASIAAGLLIASHKPDDLWLAFGGWALLTLVWAAIFRLFVVSQWKSKGWTEGVKPIRKPD